MMPESRATPSSWRSDLWLLAALVAGAAVFRSLIVLGMDRIVWGDEPFYLWLGRNWLTGVGYTFTGYQDVHHTPLLPLVSGLLYLATGSMVTASNIIFVVFGALLTAPIFLLGRELYGRAAGLTAGILVSVWPALTIGVLYWGTMTEPLYFVFVYSGVFCGLLALRERGRWPYFLAGLFFALAYLTRPEAIGYLALVTGFIALVRLCERRLFTRRSLAGLALIILGYLTLFFPYAAYVHQTTGQWMVSEKAGVTYVTSKSLATGDTATFDKLTWGLDTAGTEVYFFSPESYQVSMVDVIMQDPLDFARLVYTNIRRFVDSLLSVRLFPYWLLPLVALGWFKRAWAAGRLKAELYLLAAISPVLGFLIFFIQDRYIAAILPGLIIWAAHGVVVVQQWLQQSVARLLPAERATRLDNTLLALLPLVALLAYLAYTGPVVARAADNGSWRFEHRSLGLWIRDYVPPGGVLMARYPAIAFYAEKRWVPTPNAPVADVLRYADIKHATYWVVDERETKKLRPQFAALLDGAQATGRLTPLYVDTSSAEKMVLYRIDPVSALPALACECNE